MSGGKQRVYETSDREEPALDANYAWKTRSRPVEVVRYGALYRAEAWFSVRPGSPHRALFVSGEGRAVAWGFSEASAGSRCAEKRRRRCRSDEEVYQDRRSRTSFYEER